MLPISSHKAVYAAFLGGGVIPLASLVVYDIDAWPWGLGALVAEVALGGFFGYLIGQHIDNKYKISCEQRVAEVISSSKTVVKGEKEALVAHAKRLTGFSADYQDRATEAATAAAKATENATIIASAIEEMDAAIMEIGRQANEASSIALTAAEKTRQADVAAGGLSSQSDEILSIVELIRAIAGKTHLLALNATIEAARAGEHGRGFAVVAQEVKQLATQTAEATTRIEGQINGVRTASHAMKEQMGALETTIENINSITQVIKKALQEETAATREIAQSAQEASRATENVTKGVSHMLITTEQIREASKALTDEADNMSCSS
jgi:methyl-accepting chemotaxis protein